MPVPDAPQTKPLPKCPKCGVTVVPTDGTAGSGLGLAACPRCGERFILYETEDGHKLEAV